MKIVEDRGKKVRATIDKKLSLAKQQFIEDEAIWRTMRMTLNAFHRYLYFKLKEVAPDFLYANWTIIDLSDIFGEKLRLQKDEKNCFILVDNPSCSELISMSRQRKKLDELPEQLQRFADKIVEEIQKLEKEIEARMADLKANLENSELYKFSQTKYVLEMMERDEKKKGKGIKVNSAGG